MRKNIKKRLLVMVAVLLCAGSGSLFFLSSPKAQIVTEKLNEKSLRESNFASLIDTAKAIGSVSVIVGFQFDFTPEGYLATSLRENQRAAIKYHREELLTRLAPFKPQNIKVYESIPYAALTVDTQTLEYLETLSEITFIREDERVAPSLFESVPIVHAPQAWSAGFSGQGQVVAILDTGVDKSHPFLSGKVISEACYSSNGQTGVYSSVCPGGVMATTATNSGLNCTFTSECNHGTHVAGIATGRLPTSSFYGVAKDANLVSIQVFSRVDSTIGCSPNPSPCAQSFGSDNLAGLQRVLTLKQGGMNIASANMSLGSAAVYTSNCDSQFPDKKAAIDNLRSVGVATTIASGNGDANGNGYNNAISSPACISSAISVGSTGDGSNNGSGPVAPLDVVSQFSNSSSFLNLLAPGAVIQSSIPGGWEFKTGTSQAAPHVAGAWAILKQQNPSASVAQIQQALSMTGQQVADTRPPASGIIKPRIDIFSAAQILPCYSPIVIGQTLNGSIATTDCSFSGTSTRYLDAYVFDGLAGQQIAISMNSTFDNYLFLLNSSGTTVAQDNNGGGGTNARIPPTSGFLTLPTTGTYLIYATSNPTNATGLYTLSLTGNCSYSLGQNSQNFAASGGNSSTNVVTSSGCSWSASSNADWITITSGSSGNGNGTVGFSVAANTGVARSGTFTAAGQTYTVNQNAGAVSTYRPPFDFDGDSKTDLSIFRPAPGEWWVSKSSDGGNFATQFGASTDVMVPVDFTGDGKTDVAYWRPSTGFWTVLRSENFTFYAFPFGANGDIPAPADFDGDGKSDAAVFRPSTVTWFISRSGDGGTTISQFGAAGDQPVNADYDGDGKSDIAIWRPNGANGAEWWISRSTGGVFATQFGSPTDKTVQGDFTGDGKADIAFWRPSNGNWFVLRSEDFSFFAFPFGSNGDIPVPGDYDGDGKFDAGVFRPSNSTWFLQRSTAGTLIQQFGIAGDRPTPSAFVR